HLAAMALSLRVSREVWVAADPERWSECLLNSAQRVDPALIAEHFDAVHEHFQSLQLPEGKEIIVACQMQAATASLARENANAQAPAASDDAPFRPTPTDFPSIAILSVFTNGVSDNRIVQASRLLTDGTLNANDKLRKIDALIRFPATASAEQLGKMLGVTKQAVLKTDWWTRNRRGEKDNEIGRRRAGHQRRAELYEPPGATDD